MWRAQCATARTWQSAAGGHVQRTTLGLWVAVCAHQSADEMIYDIISYLSLGCNPDRVRLTPFRYAALRQKSCTSPPSAPGETAREARNENASHSVSRIAEACCRREHGKHNGADHDACAAAVQAPDRLGSTAPSCCRSAEVQVTTNTPQPSQAQPSEGCGTEAAATATRAACTASPY